MIKIAVNGRFLARPVTGVDRVAEEMLRAFDRLIGAGAPEIEGMDVSILTPERTQRSLGLDHIQEIKVGRRSGHFWEQAELPGASKGRWLLNLCNTGPLATASSLVVIHDAQVFQSPKSYSRAFRLFYKGLLPLLGRRAAAVVTVSRFSRSEIERYGIVPRGKSVVIANGSDHVDRLEADETTLERHKLVAGRYCLALGSLSPHKNLATLLKADALRESSSSMPLVIAGGTNSQVFAGAGLPVRGDERVLGRVSDGELKALYQNAAVLLFPSFFEGFGLPPLEAMRCGCPVIASTAAAVKETCGDAALYADPSQPAEWARQIDRLLADTDLQNALRLRGRARSETFEWRASAIELLDLVRKHDTMATP